MHVPIAFASKSIKNNHSIFTHSKNTFFWGLSEWCFLKRNTNLLNLGCSCSTFLAIVHWTFCCFEQNRRRQKFCQSQQQTFFPSRNARNTIFCADVCSSVRKVFLKFEIRNNVLGKIRRKKEFLDKWAPWNFTCLVKIMWMKCCYKLRYMTYLWHSTEKNWVGKVFTIVKTK